MKLSNWNINIQRVLEWMNTTENDISKEATAINALIGLAEGVTDEDALGGYWTSIRSVGSTVDDFPKARVGHAPSLPVEVGMNVDSVMNHIASVFASAFDEIVAQVMLPRGQAYRYEEASQYGDAMADRVKSLLEKTYKDGRWDGTLDDNGVPSVALVEKEEASE